MTHSLVQSVRVQVGKALGSVADNVLKDGTGAKKPAKHALKDSTKTLILLRAFHARAAAQGSTQHPQVSAKLKSARAPVGLAPQPKLAPRMVPQSARRATQGGTRTEILANHTPARAATGLPRQDRHARATAPSARRATMGTT